MSDNSPENAADLYPHGNYRGGKITRNGLKEPFYFVSFLEFISRPPGGDQKERKSGIEDSDEEIFTLVRIARAMTNPSIFVTLEEVYSTHPLCEVRTERSGLTERSGVTKQAHVSRDRHNLIRLS